MNLLATIYPIIHCHSSQFDRILPPIGTGQQTVPERREWWRLAPLSPHCTGIHRPNNVPAHPDHWGNSGSERPAHLHTDQYPWTDTTNIYHSKPIISLCDGFLFAETFPKPKLVAAKPMSPPLRLLASREAAKSFERTSISLRIWAEFFFKLNSVTILQCNQE